jgi:aminoglycoside phosphotransferase (APT) family kinase protein
MANTHLMQYAHLNQPDTSAESASDAERRVLARLGDDVALIVRQLNLRPTAAAQLPGDARCIRVRVTIPGEHVLIRIAPEGDLAADLVFSRALERRGLPTPRVLYADLTRVQLPFAYLVETFVGGPRADTLRADYQLRAAGMQLGRVARRMHQIPAPGWGRPPSGSRSRSWSCAGWQELVEGMLGEGALEAAGRLLFGEELQARLLAAIRAGDDAPTEPRLVHGELGPERLIVTPGEQTQLLALVEPGALIGGDPLLDLAHASGPGQPEAFREGVLAGYAAAALPEAEQRRLRRARLLDSYLSACRCYLLALPHAPAANLARALLAEAE